MRMSTNPLLLEAIALKKCVTTIYNGVAMKLAPHVLYTKNNALFIDAITLEKHGEPPREKKLGATASAKVQNGGTKGCFVGGFQNEPSKRFPGRGRVAGVRDR